MKPVYVISVGGRDITSGMKEAGLSSVTTNDEAGFKSDSVSLDITDPHREIALPRLGAVIEVALGWEHSGAVHVGTYTVDTASRGGRPSVISISGNGADLGKTSTLKAQKTRSFDQITIGALVTQIAGEHGLKAATGRDYAALVLPHVDQVNESDMNLLTRLAADHGAIFKVADGYALFVKQGEGRAASGKAMPEVTITEDMCTPDWRIEVSERTAYGAVIAQWRDGDNAALKDVKVGDGEPVFTIRKPFATEAAAQAAAQAKKDALARGTGKASLTLAYGIPSICAETPLNLSGFDPEADGKWVAVKVSHRLSGSGLTTSIEAEPPNA